LAANASGEALKTVLTSLEDAKAEDIVTIDIQNKSTLGDYMVVASGRSSRHVGAVADRLLRALKEGGYGPLRVEGLPNCDWVLIDAGDLIVHIFRPEIREFYNLEKMWAADPYSERRVLA
jgi:ribosome-associated protein